MVRVLALLGILPVCVAFLASSTPKLRGTHKVQSNSCSIRRVGPFVHALHAPRRPRCGLQSIMASSAETGEITPDELIEKLVAAPPYEIPGIVAKNLKKVSSPSFFIRIAELSDQATNTQRKESLSALADNLVATLEAVMTRTEERMDGAAKLVQSIVASAAEPNGEFVVPLTAERIGAMRKLVSQQREQIDEGILSTIFAYMKKANEDGLEGMVVIFQKVLQLWAAEELVSAGPGNAVLERLLRANTEEWDNLIQQAVDGGETDAEVLQAAVQSCVERVVLQQASGSYGQRVEAEFLRELMARVRQICKPEA